VEAVDDPGYGRPGRVHELVVEDHDPGERERAEQAGEAGEEEEGHEPPRVRATTSLPPVPAAVSPTDFAIVSVIAGRKEVKPP
jgi:hypothetical protein